MQLALGEQDPPASSPEAAGAGATLADMSLSEGDRMGRYEVVGVLGRGGMGEVYRARDVDLQREVALKILPEDLDDSPDHLERFEREARMLASLNHPNIATLYGYERDGDATFLAMELVEGETLAHQLGRGPLPWQEALPLFLQIARGLEAAHERGVVHRDLKPSNVEISDGRTAKLLDFGLARDFDLRGPSGSDSPAGDSPTLPHGITRSGVILGTAAYMSPEQAKGREVDKRSDIWAFGCCLYEALVGEPPMVGDSVSETIANLLKDEPDWDRLPTDLPPSLGRLLRRCLDKDVYRRMRDIGDAAYEIEELIEGDLSDPPISDPHRAGARPTLRSGFAWAATAVATGLAAALLYVVFWPSANEDAEASAGTVRRFEIPLPEARGGIHSLDVSHDGRFVVVAAGDAVHPLQLRRMDRNTIEPVAGTERGEFPFFSPDGSRIGFFTRAGNDLKVVAVEGGPVTSLTEDLVRNWGGSWGDDGRIVFHSQRHGNGLSRITANGGDPEVLTLPKAEDGQHSHRWPQVLPGSRWVVFTIWGGSHEHARVALLSLEDRSIRELTAGTYGRVLPSGHLLFFDGSRALVAAFDVASGELAGPARPIAGVEATGPWGMRQVAVADDGLLVRGLAALNRPVWLDLEGAVTEIGIEPGVYHAPAVSSAGDRLALSVAVAGEWADIWVFELDGERRDRLTFEGINESPVWAANDEWIAYWSEREGTRTVYRRRVDGGGEAEVLVNGAHGRPVAATADGRHVATNHAGNVWLVPTEAGQPEPLFENRFLAGNVSFSPDGRAYAFMSDDSGYFQAYISRIDGSTGRVPISQGTIVDVLWSPTGNTVLYRTEDGIYKVSVEVEPEIRIGSPVRVGDDRYVQTTGRDWSFGADGKRVLVLADAVSSRLFVVEHWLSEVTAAAETR
jgi:serine/threonine-protein kinase